MYCIASRAVNACVSQDLLRLIKQLSRAVALREVFAKKRFASSLYTLPVFDMEACQEPPLPPPLSYIHPVLPLPLSLHPFAPYSAIGRERDTTRGEEYVRNLVTVYPALIVAIIYVARPKFQVVRD